MMNRSSRISDPLAGGGTSLESTEPASLQPTYAALGEAARRVWPAGLAEALRVDLLGGGRRFGDLFEEVAEGAKMVSANAQPGDVIVATPCGSEEGSRIEVVALNRSPEQVIEALNSRGPMFLLRPRGESDGGRGEVMAGLDRPDIAESGEALEVTVFGAEAAPTVVRPRPLRAEPAPAPCLSPGRHFTPRVRSRSRYGRRFVRWVQRGLNHALGTRLVLDGRFGPRTRRALVRFQRLVGITADGRLGPVTEGALKRHSGVRPPHTDESLSSGDLAPLAAAGVAAGIAGVSLQFVEFGMNMIERVTSGGLVLLSPQGAFGVRSTPVPPHFDMKTLRRSSRIVDFEESLVGVEQVNVKLRCTVQYNGLMLRANLGFDPGGDRSRLGVSTRIVVRPALELEELPAPKSWVRCGVPRYAVLRIPFEFRVDRPWPASNYSENFELVLSTMYGFGASAHTRAHVVGPPGVWN